MRQMLMTNKWEININTIIVKDSNTPLTQMNRSYRQNINKETQTLNNILGQLKLIDIYRAFHPKKCNFTVFSSAHETLSRTDNTLGHKSNPDKLKKKLKSFQTSFLTTKL